MVFGKQIGRSNLFTNWSNNIEMLQGAKMQV